MDWILLLTVILLGLILLMFIKVPVAFAFFVVNIIAAFFIWNGQQGLMLLVKNIKDSLTVFSLLPIPLFILMGEVLFQSGLAKKMINTLDKWFGNIPGRLSLLAVGGGTLLSTLTASSISTTAMLGSTLLPEMQKKKYDKNIAMGPIMASGGLAIMIPPSALGVLLASLAKVSVGQFLVAIIIPGILMALFFFIYIIVISTIRPELAPKYEVDHTTFSEKIIDAVKYILPLSSLIVFVIGSIFLGIASPTESAAIGALGSFILSLCYRQLSMEVIIKSLRDTLKLTTMILMIVAGSTIFAQILSFSGIARSIVSVVEGLMYPDIVIIIIMLIIVLLLGTFMESLAMMMIVVPIYMPIAIALNFDTLWFAVLLLLAIEIGQITPPFGVGLFVMKGVAPSNVTMLDIYKSAIPFIILLITLLVILVQFPILSTWLPDLMKN